MCFPLLIVAAGIGVSFLCTLIATHVKQVKNKEGIEPALKLQIIVSTILMTPVVYGVCVAVFPASFAVSTKV
jgi:inorganic pyrophosphatase